MIENVFIIMPFGAESVAAKDGPHNYTKAHFDDVYRALVDGVTDHRKKIVVDRMQQPYGNLVRAIIERLASADVVIAVLTGRNPNVFYELGIRHSLRKNTIMLVEHWEEYPFDLSSYFSHRYSIEHAADRDDLISFIKSRLADLDSKTLPDSPVMDILHTSEFEQLRVINTWETRRAAMLIDGLVREVMGIYSVFDQCLVFAHKAMDGKAGKQRPHLDLEWDVMDGFTKNRPIPGISRQAYSDAENMYRSWRAMQRLWNDTLDSDKKLDGERLENIVAATERPTVAFLYDLIQAWTYIMERRVCFGIPWSSSLEKVEELVKTGETLVMVREEVLKKANARIEEFVSFDKQFMGVPESMIQDVLKSATSGALDLSAMIKLAPKTTSDFDRLVATTAKKKSPAPKRTTKPRKRKSTPRPATKKTRRATKK